MVLEELVFPPIGGLVPPERRPELFFASDARSVADLLSYVSVLKDENRVRTAGNDINRFAKGVVVNAVIEHLR